MSSYSCSGWSETGPEKVHKITTTVSGNITAALSNLASDLDVFILNACNTNSCVAYATNTATYLNAPPGTYYIVVDGYNGVSGSYTLTVNIPTPSTPTPTRTPTPTPTQTPIPTPTATRTPTPTVTPTPTPKPSSATISGYVVAFPNLSGVQMSGLPGVPRTNGTGYYTAAVTVPWSGTVTPQKTGYTFSPVFRSYNAVTTNQSFQNYSAFLVGTPTPTPTVKPPTPTPTPTRTPIRPQRERPRPRQPRFRRCQRPSRFTP